MNFLPVLSWASSTCSRDRILFTVCGRTGFLVKTTLMPGERPSVGTFLSLQPLGTFFLVPLCLELVDGCPTPNLKLMFGGSAQKERVGTLGVAQLSLF